jgi:hypothetical protein
MDWRKGSTIEIYRRRRPSAGAIHRIALLQSGSRIIAALLAWAPVRPAAEQESGGV